MVQGSQILCNNGRYEFLTTSIAEVFVTRMSKRCLISWRWHKDWAVFQKNVVVTSLLGCGFVHFYLTIRYDSHRRWLSRRLEGDFCDCHRLMQASCHSRAFKVLDPRVDDIDLERFCDVAPVMMIRMCSSSIDADWSASCFLFSLNYYQLLIGNRAKTRSIDSGQSFPEPWCLDWI